MEHVSEVSWVSVGYIKQIMGVHLFQERNAQILVNFDCVVLFWAILGAILFVCVCAILGHFGCNFVCVCYFGPFWVQFCLCVLFWAILGAILSVLR